MKDDLKVALQKFTQLIEQKEVSLPQDALESELISVLDEITYTRRFGNFQIDKRDFPDSQRVGEEFRPLVEKKFRDVGYYNSLAHVSTHLQQTDVLTGDAIDDILDIYKDIKEVLWRWENTSQDDALWFLQESFESHWGRHLRDLQLYLHCKSRGE